MDHAVWKKENMPDIVKRSKTYKRKKPPMSELQRKIQWAQNKDKRIAFLSLFSSLSKALESSTNTPEQADLLFEKAVEYVEKLYEKFPFPSNGEESDHPF